MKSLIPILLVLLAPSTFAAVELHCPEKIETNQSLSKPVDGWKAGLDADMPQWYERFQIFSGPPSEKASLIPETSKGQEFWTYDSQHGLWMQCLYSHSTVTLEMEIPKTVKKCFAKKAQTDKKYFLSCQ